MRQALVSHTIAPEREGKPVLPAPTPEEISEWFPQFEILECLGRGGMGVVYKARQKSLNRLVAIKILGSERAGEARFAERFAHEAELLAQLNQPNIVTIHDFGETDGLYFLVMEYVDGVNLRDLIAEGKLDPTEALAIVSPICEALQYAHKKGIVHRDIKPENLLFDREGGVKIADFGIASLIGSSVEGSGTPPYMAPEQASQVDADHRADIYALGVVLYEMLTGERPNEPFAIPSQKVEIDARLDDVVLRALNTDPERRYQTAGEFRTRIETFSEESSPPVLPSRPGTSPKVALQEPPKKKSPLVGCLIAAAVGFVVFLIGVIAFAVVAYLSFEGKKAEVLDEETELSGWAVVKCYDPDKPELGVFTATIPLSFHEREEWFPSPNIGQQMGQNDDALFIRVRVQRLPSGNTDVSVAWNSKKEVRKEEGRRRGTVIGPKYSDRSWEFENGLHTNIKLYPASYNDVPERTTKPWQTVLMLSLFASVLWVVLAKTLSKKKPGSFRLWWLIPIMVFAGLVLGLLYAFIKGQFWPSEFVASATLLENGHSPPTELDFSQSYFDFKMALLKSRSVLESTSERLSLSKRWNLSEDLVVSHLADAISTRQRTGTDLIELTVTLGNREEAFEIAETLFEIIEEDPVLDYDVLDEVEVSARPPRNSFLIGPLVGAALFSFFALGLMEILHRRRGTSVTESEF